MKNFMNRLVAKKTMGMVGSLSFFIVCLYAVILQTPIPVINAILGPLGLFVVSLYGIKAVSGNVSKHTDMIGEKKK